jgi:VTC domain-containing protein
VASAGAIQAARFEFKYLVDEYTAKHIRRFVLMYLDPDAYTVGRERIGYPVHSLYLDSPDLQLCRATTDGLKNRFKLRLRFYESDSERVFFEVKRRVNDVILKQRAAVRRSSVPRLIAGECPRPDDLICCDKRSKFALYEFCRLRDELAAIPAAYTSYYREGYEPPDSNLNRVTFDRTLRAGDFRGNLSVADLDNWPCPSVEGTVLELKFTDMFPTWMQTMVESFDLMRTSMPKYVKCVSMIRDSRFWPLATPVVGEPSLEENTASTLLRCA